MQLDEYHERKCNDVNACLLLHWSISYANEQFIYVSIVNKLRDIFMRYPIKMREGVTWPNQPIIIRDRLNVGIIIDLVTTAHLHINVTRSRDVARKGVTCYFH